MSDQTTAPVRKRSLITKVPLAIFAALVVSVVALAARPVMVLAGWVPVWLARWIAAACAAFALVVASDAAVKIAFACAE